MKSGGYDANHIFKVHIHGLEVPVYTISQWISNNTKPLPSRVWEGVFDLDSYLGYLPIHLFVFWCQWMELRCFLWSHDFFEFHKSRISISEHMFHFCEIFYPHFFKDWTVMFLSFTGFWEDQDTLGLICNNAILDCMSFLFPWVKLLLYFSFLWSLDPAFASIQEEIFEMGKFTNKIFYISNLSFWKYLFSSECHLKNRKIFHYPIMCSSFARTIPKEPHHLKCQIETDICQDEEELFFRGGKKSFRSSPSNPSFEHFPWLLLFFSSFLSIRIERIYEHGEKILEIRQRNACQSSEYTRILLSVF